MNRFEYARSVASVDETIVAKCKGIKLYNGDQKTKFEDGELVLTTHRLLWSQTADAAGGSSTLSLNLKYVLSLDEEIASAFVFGRKKRIIVHLMTPATDKSPGPMDGTGDTAFIKISGRNGIDELFITALGETVSARVWETTESNSEQTTSTGSQSNDAPPPRIKLRTGIVGIERSLQERQKQTDESITIAFKDLSKLMAMAKDMVGISKVISTKIRERHGDISEDETVRFKSYLMSLGIDDPVTRDNAQSNTEYFQLLANQICEVLLDPIVECGGMMSLADAYCRINRARGLELLSPEDLLNACRWLNGPLKLRTFPSGAMVLQLENHDDEMVSKETLEHVNEASSLSVEQLAQILNISLLLAQERLLTAERSGKICRDESIEGLKFYPNRFLEECASYS